MVGPIDSKGLFLLRGEQVGFSDLWILPMLVVASILGLIVAICRLLWRRGERRRAVLFGSGLVLVLLGAEGFVFLANLEALPLGVATTFDLILSACGLLLLASSLGYDRGGRPSESECRWCSVAACRDILVAGTDRAGRIDYVNPAFEEVSGFPAAELAGRPLPELLSGDETTGIREVLSRASTSAAASPIKLALRTRDGGQRFIHGTFAGLHGTDGEVTGALLIAIDVSAQRLAEASGDISVQPLQETVLNVQTSTAGLEGQALCLEREVTTCHGFEDMVGQSQALRAVLARVEQVAPSATTVLIEGETGVGKELVARAIHRLSVRHERPLVKVSCAALPPTLIEAELFGYEKGAFTGAFRRHRGYFEAADGGTLFLDEIGELALGLQSKLLEVLQSGELERIGGERLFRVDVRFIAATNRRLRDQVEQGRFRKDLYYRLNAYSITVPPLRERKDDIPLLVNALVNKFADALGKRIERVPSAVMGQLLAYEWPGNVRELENVIRRAVLATSSDELSLGDPLCEDPIDPAMSDLAATGQRTLEQVERDYIRQVLQQCAGRIEGVHGAAKWLGLNPSTLRSRMRKLGIKYAPSARRAGSWSASSRSLRPLRAPQARGRVRPP